MRIFKRGEVYWAQIHGKRKSLRTTDRTAAELAFRRLQRLAADPEHPAAHPEETIGKWVNRLIDAKRGRAGGTRHMYDVKLRHVVRVLGEAAPLTAITPESVDAYIAQRRAEKASDNTIGKELTAIVQLCKLARRAGKWRGDVTALRPPDFGTGYVPRERVLRVEDEAALRAVCTPTQWSAIAFVLGTGCRLGEAFRARPEDIDWTRLEVRIRGTKTAASAAVIPIVEAGGLAAHLREAQLPIDWPRMSGDLPRLCARAEIPPLSPNDLRRTVATRLIEAGVDPYDAAKITRHATLGMLRRVYDRSAVTATRQRIDRAADGTRKVQRRRARKGGTPKT